jgi:hypothetical protein
MTIATKTLLPYAAILLGLTLSSQASAANLSTLPQNAALFGGQRLVDANCYNHLEMQSDGNLVVYAGIGTSIPQALWSSRTSGIEGAPDGYSYLESSGNFATLLYPPVSEYAGFVPETFWSSGSESYVPVALEMQTDGNLVLYPANSIGTNAIWASNTSECCEDQPPPPVSCPMESSYTQLYPNVYLNGLTPVSTFELFGSGACGTQCAAAGSCTGWTSSGDTCTMYTGIPTIVTNHTIVNPALNLMSGIIVKPRLEIIRL